MEDLVLFSFAALCIIPVDWANWANKIYYMTTFVAEHQDLYDNRETGICIQELSDRVERAWKYNFYALL